MKYIITLIIVLGLGYGAYLLFPKNNAQIQEIVDPKNQDSVIAYISKNISELSPQKETVGGTFYVTNITFDRGSGTVDYEDGHNAYTANFSYIFSDTGVVDITSFVIVE